MIGLDSPAPRRTIPYSVSIPQILGTATVRPYRSHIDGEHCGARSQLVAGASLVDGEHLRRSLQLVAGASLAGAPEPCLRLRSPHGGAAGNAWASWRGHARRGRSPSGTSNTAEQPQAPGFHGEARPGEAAGRVGQSSPGRFGTEPALPPHPMTTTDVTIRHQGETSVLGPDQSLTFGRTVEGESGCEGDSVSCWVCPSGWLSSELPPWWAGSFLPPFGHAEPAGVA